MRLWRWNLSRLGLACLVMALAGGCRRDTIPSAATGSPYASYLPSAPPSEKNRVTHPAGFSIACPPGWTSRVITIEPFLKDRVTDQFELYPEEEVESKPGPKITIQRMGSAAKSSWELMLNPEWNGRYGRQHTQFQGEPAISHFLPGSGKSQAVRGQYQPWLLQQVYFKRFGDWFGIIFEMRNADDGNPYYTQPLDIVDAYFATFSFSPPKK
jgi:hypothetical protein